jgi:hypothetical protein
VAASEEHDRVAARIDLAERGRTGEPVGHPRLLEERALYGVGAVHRVQRWLAAAHRHQVDVQPSVGEDLPGIGDLRGVRAGRPPGVTEPVMTGQRDERPQFLRHSRRASSGLRPHSAPGGRKKESRGGPPEKRRIGRE